MATLARAEPTLLAEISKLEAREKELSTPSALRGLIEPGADVARRWETTPMSTRRQIARLLLTRTSSASYDYYPHPRAAGVAGHRPTSAPNGGADNGAPTGTGLCRVYTHWQRSAVTGRGAVVTPR